jgi:hypothetical protein
LYDGGTIFIVCEIAPPDDETLIISSVDASEYNPENSMGVYYYNFTDSKDTIGDYMKKHGYTKVMCAGASLSDAERGAGIDSSYQWDLVDGKLLYRIESVSDVMQLLRDGKAELTCKSAEISKCRPVEQSDFATTTVPVKYQPKPVEAETRVFDLEADFPAVGIAVHRVTMWGSPVALYVSVDWSVTDEDAYRANGEGLQFELLDEDGRELEFIRGGGTAEIGKTEFLVNAEETIPENLTFRAYNGYTKEQYGSAALG